MACRGRTELGDQARGVLDALGQSVVVTDLDRRITYWNRAAEQLFGWTAEEALDRSSVELLAPDQSAAHGAEVVAMVAAGSHQRCWWWS